jgi:integrase/recombinase XerD
MNNWNTSTALVPHSSNRSLTLVSGEPLPDIITSTGQAATTAWHDFFQGRIANDHTRAAYERAVRCFLAWCRNDGHELHTITAADVGQYLRQLPGGLSKKKQHLSGLRRFFNLLVERHLVVVNPAAVAETERCTVLEGKTPEITREQCRKLLESIDTRHVVGLRDRAVIATMMYTAARAGAVAKLQLEHYYDAGDQWMLHFDDKGNKSREIPVSHDLKVYLDEYLDATGIRYQPRHRDPLSNDWLLRFIFRTAVGNEKRLTRTGMNSKDVCRMVKRRLRTAGLPTNLSPHFFRVAVATDLLDQKVSLDDVQRLLGHADPRTTKLYDRREKKITRNIVERIRLGR